MQDQRPAQQGGHHSPREGDVAAHAENHVGIDLADHLLGLPEAPQRGEIDPDHLEPVLRHQARFHTVGIAEPADIPAASAHVFGNCEGRKDMPASPASHHEKRLGHSLPPRINSKFWLRPRCALNAGCAGFASAETGN
jgi:hypothetical protein